MPIPLRPSEGPLVLLHLPTGRAEFFNDRRSAANALRGRRIGPLRGDPPPDAAHGLPGVRPRGSNPSDWSLTTAYGQSLGWADLPDSKRAICPWPIVHRWEVGSRRRDPVAGTGHRPAGRHCFRYPKTLRCLREACALNEDDRVAPVRPSRRKRGIPTAWDDLNFTRTRSWKKHRRTRWKPTG